MGDLWDESDGRSLRQRSAASRTFPSAIRSITPDSTRSTEITFPMMNEIVEWLPWDPARGHYHRKVPFLRCHDRLRPFHDWRRTHRVRLHLYIPQSSTSESSKFQQAFNLAVGRFQDLFARQGSRLTRLREPPLRERSDRNGGSRHVIRFQCPLTSIKLESRNHVLNMPMPSGPHRLVVGASWNMGGIFRARGSNRRPDAPWSESGAPMRLRPSQFCPRPKRLYRARRTGRSRSSHAVLPTASPCR